MVKDVEVIYYLGLSRWVQYHKSGIGVRGTERLGDAMLLLALMIEEEAAIESRSADRL